MTTAIRRAAVVWTLLALRLVYVARQVDRVTSSRPLPKLDPSFRR